VALNHDFPQDFRRQAAADTQRREMNCAETHVANFIVKDSLEQAHTGRVTSRVQPLNR
jgi:hypothetical protein